MASFDLFMFLNVFLGGFNVPELGSKVSAWLAAEGERYPDLKDRTDALSAWLVTVLSEAEPNMNPAAMKATVLTIAKSIVQGTAGIDPDAWIFG